MSNRPSILADLCALAWVVFVGVMYFGGYFSPETVGVFTGQSCIIYGGVLLLAAASAALRYLSSGTRSADVRNVHERK